MSSPMITRMFGGSFTSGRSFSTRLAFVFVFFCTVHSDLVATLSIERMNDFPILLHVDDDQAAGRRLVERAAQRANARAAVVCVFAHGVRVVNDDTQSRTGSRRRPFEHLEVAIGVAERRDRPAADLLLNADGLAGFVVDQVDCREPIDARLAAAGLVFQLHAAADDLPGGIPYTASTHGRRKSTPPPDTMKVLKPFARR